MPTWNLKRLVIKNGKSTAAKFVADEFTLARYQCLLEKAASSNCTRPTYSNFHVKGSVSEIDGLHAGRSGNVEYGICQALHNEEMTVAALISRRNSSAFVEPPVMAIVVGTGKPRLENLVNPCGNCRDILRDTFGPDCTILAGTEAGGLALVTKLSDMLFDQYVKLSEKGLKGGERGRRYWIAAVRRGEEVEDNPFFDPQKHPLRRYFVGLYGGSGFIYVGGAVVGDDYHPTYPIEFALQSLKEHRESLRTVVVVAEGDGTAPPDVMYRDRQRLLEYSVRVSLVTGERFNPRVVLHTHLDGEPTGTWVTNAEQWLPRAFTARKFSPEFQKIYAEYYKKKYSYLIK